MLTLSGLHQNWLAKVYITVQIAYTQPTWSVLMRQVMHSSLNTSYNIKLSNHLEGLMKTVNSLRGGAMSILLLSNCQHTAQCLALSRQSIKICWMETFLYYYSFFFGLWKRKLEIKQRERQIYWCQRGSGLIWSKDNAVLRRIGENQLKALPGYNLYPSSSMWFPRFSHLNMHQNHVGSLLKMLMANS